MLVKRRVAPYFLLVVLVILAWLSFRITAVFLSDLLFALFLAFLTYPLYSRLLRRVRRPGIAAGLMLLLMTLAILVPAGLIGWQLIREGRAITEELRGTDPKALLDDLETRAYALVGVPPPAQGNGTGLAEGIYGTARDTLDLFIRTIPARAAEALVGLFVLYFVLYYAYKDGPRVLGELRELVPLRSAHRDLLFTEIGNTVRGVVYGSILTSLTQAAFAGIGFWIFGVHKVVLWSVLVFILGLLPVVGAPMVYVPWSLYLAATGRTWQGLGLLAYSAIFVNGLEHLVRPLMIGRVTKIHPVTVLLGVLGGVVVFGFVGFILGPLILSVFVKVLDIYRKEFAPVVPEGPAPKQTP